MKFGHEYETTLAGGDFPEEWKQSSIDYKHLKKCIKRVHDELDEMGLDEHTLQVMSELVAKPMAPKADSNSIKEYFSAANPSLAAIEEEFTPSLRILVDSKSGVPLDARLSPETKESLRKLAQSEPVIASRKKRLEETSHIITPQEEGLSTDDDTALRRSSVIPDRHDGKWIDVPLASAKDFFELLEPKLAELEALRDAEVKSLEEQILDLGDLVEDVVQPVMEGYEARREISYRDLYFWREMFRMYLENPVFYRQTEQKRGAITYDEAKHNLKAYNKELKDIGLIEKLKTPQAKAAAAKFFDINVSILRIMHFQEMNARAMRKILKKFNKQTHLEGQVFAQSLQSKHPEMLGNNKSAAGGLADSIARDLQAEMGSKVLAIVPQLDDWICPVCYGMAWRPVNLGCCRSVFCIRCIIQLQDQGMKKCPMCNAETVMQANGNNIDFDTMDFLGIYFPMEVKKRQKENERAQLVRNHGEEFVKPGCTVM